MTQPLPARAAPQPWAVLRKEAQYHGFSPFSFHRQMDLRRTWGQAGKNKGARLIARSREVLSHCGARDSHTYLDAHPEDPQEPLSTVASLCLISLEGHWDHRLLRVLQEPSSPSFLGQPLSVRRTAHGQLPCSQGSTGLSSGQQGRTRLSNL